MLRSHFMVASISCGLAGGVALLSTAPASIQAQTCAVYATAGSAGVAVIDTTLAAVTTTVPVGIGPFSVAATPDGTRVYVANGGGGVSVIDTTTNSVVGAPVVVGLDPTAVAISPDGSRAYVTNQSSGTVSVISTATNSVDTTITVGGNPYAIAMTPNGAFVYVTFLGSPGSVLVIDTPTNSLLGAPIVVGNNPQGIAITPDGAFAYVTNTSSDAVTVIDTAATSVVANIPVGDRPFGIAITPDGAFAYVANAGSDSVSVVDLTTNAVVGTPIAVGAIPRGIAIHPDGSRAYVANNDAHDVRVIDTSSRTVVGSPIPLGGSPFGVAVVSVAGGCPPPPEPTPIATPIPDCPGSCAAELQTLAGQKAVEKYLKAVLRELRGCAENGTMTCPCPTPNAAKLLARLAAKGELGLECAGVLACRANGLLNDILGQHWDSDNSCYVGPVMSQCDVEAVRQASKLAVKRFKRERTNKSTKNLRDTTACIRAIARKCSAGESSGGAVCAAGAGVAGSVTAPTPCDLATASYSDQDVQDAVQQALAGIGGVGPEVWEDPAAFSEVFFRTGAKLGCNFPVTDTNGDGFLRTGVSATARAVSRQAGGDCGNPPTGGTYQSSVAYCGPGSSAEPTTTGLSMYMPWWLVSTVGNCLNTACFDHDACYRDFCVAECLNTSDCMWSILSDPCDIGFFADGLFCAATLRCNTSCKTVIHIAAGIKSTEFGRLSCLPNGSEDCRDMCVDGCCSEQTQCEAAPTRTATASASATVTATATRSNTATGTTTMTPTATATATNTSTPTAMAAMATVTATHTNTPLTGPITDCSFVARPGTGAVRRTGSPYSSVHDASAGDSLLSAVQVTQSFDPGLGWYTIDRGFLMFDTNSLPDGATITGATLYVWVITRSGYIGQSIQIVGSNQQSTSSLTTGDYSRLATALAGSIEASALAPSSGVAADRPIALNGSGLGLISKTGFTKLGLRDSRDVGNNADTNAGFVWIEGLGGSHPPFLCVSY